MSRTLISLCLEHPFPIRDEQALNLYNSMSDEYKKWVEKQHFVKFMGSQDRASFLWHDYEAGGTNARSTPPMQCAMIRTDEELNIIDIPIDLYCKLHGDKLPHPVAIRITKIDPMYCLEHGLPEPVFFRAINEQMTLRGTCNAGYNSQAYDDQMTRFGLWRNLLPVYNREWANGCSRIDLYPITAAYAGLNVNGITWPKNDEGKISLRLEDLSKANAITQDNAHNAVDDVKALIGWARVLKSSDPTLWNTLFMARTKNYNKSRLKPGTIGWLIHKSIGHESSFKAPIIIMKDLPGDAQAVSYARLDKMDSIRAIYGKDIDFVRQALYMKKDEREILNVERPGVGTLKANQQPQFFPIGSEIIPANWTIDESWVAAGKNLLMAEDFVSLIGFALAHDEPLTEQDPQLALYSAGFASKDDERAISIVTSTKLDHLVTNPVSFQAEHYKELQRLMLMKITEDQAWWEHCKKSLNQPVVEDKHEAVTWSNVMLLLSNAELPEDLHNGYMAFLTAVSKQTGLDLPS